MIPQPTYELRMGKEGLSLIAPLREAFYQRHSFYKKMQDHELHDDKAAHLIAFMENTVVGSISLIESPLPLENFIRIEPHGFDPSSVCEIKKLVVSIEDKTKAIGIFLGLLREALKYCLQKELKQLFLAVSPYREESVPFLTELGFKKIAEYLDPLLGNMKVFFLNLIGPLPYLLLEESVLTILDLKFETQTVKDSLLGIGLNYISIGSKPQTPHKEVLPVAILGTGFYVPKEIVTNKKLEESYGIQADWIKRMTGIEERRKAAQGEACTDLAIPAAQQAIQNAKIKPEDVDLIILATVNSDYLAPPGSCIIQGKIGATKAACFDINAACMSFLYGLSIGSQYIAAGSFENILVVASDIATLAGNTKDKETFILLGDGAGAAVLQKASNASRKGILSSYFCTDGTRWDTVTILCGGTRYPLTSSPLQEEHLFRMNGRSVFKFAVTKMKEAIEKVCEQANITQDDVSLIIPHQANLRILKTAMKKLGVSDDKFFVDIEKYGNSSSATIAIALADAHAQKRIKLGDLVLLVGFGAGLSWGAILLRW